MSRENVQLVRAAYAAFNQGDVATVLAILDPHIDFRINPAAPESGTHHGHEGVKSWLSDVAETQRI